jgi:hypothetical protein
VEQDTGKTMNEAVINHLFAVVQSLEKCLGNSDKMLVEQTFQPREVETSLAQQHALLAEMRKTAKQIQVDYSVQNWAAITRSLKIFYGLNTMVRPEIVSTFSQLARKEICLSIENQGAEMH